MPASITVRRAFSFILRRAAPLALALAPRRRAAARRVPAIAVAVLKQRDAQLARWPQHGVAVDAAPRPVAQRLHVVKGALALARTRHKLPPRGGGARAGSTFPDLG